MTESNTASPRWSGSTKLVVALAVTTLLGLAVWRFQFLVIPLTGAAMLAYLLHPIITFFSDRFKWPRAVVTVLLYVLLLLAIIALATGAGIYIVGQVSLLSGSVQEIIAGLPARIDAVIHSQYTLFGFVIDLNRFDFSQLYVRVAEAIQPALAEAGARVGEAASGTAEFLGWMLFVLLISFYLVNEMPKLPAMIGRFASGPGYESDVRRMLRETQKIWDAFLRGQLALAITVGVLNWIGLWILGVRYSLVIGLLSGILIFIPYVGPTAITLVGAGVALFQVGNSFGIDPVPFAITVSVWFFVTQQFADYVLAPRIIGEHLELHPAIILVGTIMGASLGGFVGLLLAAPVLATLKLLGRYAWRKLLDQPPFPEDETHHPPKPMFTLPKIDLKALFSRGKKPGSAPTDTQQTK